MRIRTYTLAAVACCSLAGRGAAADASSRDMVEKGIQLRREHRDAEALEQFRRAEQLNPAPRIRAQIGLAEQALAQWVEAERDLTQALSAKDDPWIREHADALENALAAIRQHLGSVTIDTNVSGAELWINGARVGLLPIASTRVGAGTVNVEIRSAGYATARRSVDVPPGKSATERLDLVPALPAPNLESSPPVDATLGADMPTPPSTHRMLAWGALGAAGAMLTVGLGAQLVNQLNAVHYNDDSQCLRPNAGTRDAQCGIYRYRAETAQTFAFVGYGGAAVFGIASGVLFLTAPSRHRAKESALWVDARPDALWVGWRGTL
jgi:hypothetical protein